MIMDDSHLAFGNHQPGSGRDANDDMANMHLDFDSLLSAEHINATFGSFETCIHHDSCLHFMQPQKLLLHDYSQTPPPTSSSALPLPRPPGRSKRGGRSSRRQTLPLSASMDHAQDYSWDHIFNSSAAGAGHFPHGGGLGICKDDDCLSISCSSACEGSCPSQCGETSRPICCDDDACGSPQLCLDEYCSAEGPSCTDENCIVVDPSTQPPHLSVSPVLSDGDKAAAAALASFGDNQSQMLPNTYVQQQQQQQQQPPPHSSGVVPSYGNLSFTNLHNTLPCGSLSIESILANLNASPSFPNQPFQWALEYALASHIIQHHDPARGLAYHGSCVANDPSQLITKCTLPKYNSHDLANTHPFLPQMQTHECGFPIQDPNEFAHHIFQEHGSNLMVNAHQPDFSGPSHSAPHNHHQDGLGPWFDFNAAPNAKHLSPSMSPLTNLSMGSSLSATPLSIPTPCPMELDASLTDAMVVPQNFSPPAAETEKPDAMAQDDPFLCRWLVGHEPSTICGQRLENDEQLQKHCKQHHLKQLKKVNGGFRCGWLNCTRDACFTQRSKVERHMQVHTGYKPVQCSVCGAALSAKQALDQHMRIHTGETPWVCKVPGCGCAFKQQSALTMHERTHTGDKPLECEICGKRFSESSNLSKHRRTHNVKGLHECQLCGKDFHRLDQLRRHVGTNHKDRCHEMDALLSEARSKVKLNNLSKLNKAKVKARHARVKTQTLATQMRCDDDGGSGGDDDDDNDGDDDLNNGMNSIKEPTSAVKAILV